MVSLKPLLVICMGLHLCIVLQAIEYQNGHIAKYIKVFLYKGGAHLFSYECLESAAILES